MFKDLTLRFIIAVLITTLAFIIFTVKPENKLRFKNQHRFKMLCILNQQTNREGLITGDDYQQLRSGVKMSIMQRRNDDDLLKGALRARHKKSKFSQSLTQGYFFEGMSWSSWLKLENKSKRFIFNFELFSN